MVDLIIYGFVGLALLVAILVFVKSKSKKLSAKDQQFYIVKWQEILDMSHNNPRHAILDADKLLDNLLSRKGYSGTFGEKLKQAGGIFTDINAVWSAHKVRNQIAHELDFNVSPDFGRSVLGKFKRALQDLGVKL
ncbi:MAG: hypothetical protein ABH856_02535 [Patescibacteria group bacterium]|nr:hypothetical protein [Patescibacteria group bacterium]